MFEHTQAITNKIVNDLKRVSFITSLVTQSLFIVYYIYSLITGSGYLVVNAILLGLATVYLVFYILFYVRAKSKKTPKKVKRTVKTIYRWIKYALHAFTLGMAVYVIYSAPDETTFIGILLTGLNAVGFVAQIVIEIFRQTATMYFKLLQTAISADVQPYIDKVNKLKNAGATVAEAVNRPIGAIARKFASRMGLAKEEEEKEEEKPDRDAEKVKEIAAAYISDKNKKKADRKAAEKQQRKEERKAVSAEMKENFKIIGQGLKHMVKKKPNEDEPVPDNNSSDAEYEIIPPDAD